MATQQAVEETQVDSNSGELSGGELSSEKSAGTAAETINSGTVDNTESRALKDDSSVTDDKVGASTESVAPQSKQQQQVVYTERERVFQADRDRAELQLKNIYKQMMPYAEFDPVTGNVLGLKGQVQQAQAQVQPGSQLDELMESALMTGNKDALKQVLSIFKDEVIKEATTQGMREVQNMSAVERETADIRKEYPNLFTEEGQPNYDDPLFIEAAKILEARPELAHPLRVRMAVEMAEGRMLKRGLPDMQQKMRDDAQTRLKGTMANAGIVGNKTSVTKDVLTTNLTNEQVSQLRREGYDDAGIARIGKIYKQAAKEGGYTL